MRILVVNPNTTLSMTEKIRPGGAGSGGRGTEIVAVSPSYGAGEHRGLLRRGVRGAGGDRRDAQGQGRRL